MNNRIIILLFVFLAANSLTGLFGQKSGGTITITGSVVVRVDSACYPVANAIIMVDGEKSGDGTDSKGFFKIKIKKDSKKIGVYTPSIGFVEELIGGRTNVNFTFSSKFPYQNVLKADSGDETVDAGYTRVKKKELTTPVDQIDGTKLQYSGYNNIYEMIRGRVPGVMVNGTSIMIRGTTSVNLSTEPLLVVDGIPVSTIENIDPQMVRSIEVLKGSAAAIYGSRGSNGVILINLLKGTDR